MIVVDASVLVEAVVRGPRGPAAAARVFADGVQLLAPAHVDLEVLSALRRLERNGVLSTDAAGIARRLLHDVGITRYGVRALADRVWQLRSNLTAYDAAYIALAEGVDAPLVTCDERLARTPGHGASVDLIR